MRHFRTNFFLLLTTIMLGQIDTCWAQTPAPATQTQFTLPLANKTSAAAVLLPTQAGQAYLVYATPTGKIGLYLLTSTTPDPIPPLPPEPPPVPPPPVPPPPVPPVPVPQRLTIAIVEDPATTTVEQRQVLADPTWRNLAAEKHDFRGIIPADVIEKGTGKPPASLAPFLDRAKLHALPWCMFTTTAGVILYEGPLPTTAAELIAIIHRYGG